MRDGGGCVAAIYFETASIMVVLMGKAIGYDN
jgi:hypothetical protein